MAFGSFKSLQEVAKTFQISVQVQSFVKPVPFSVNQVFQDELKFSMENLGIHASDEAICEFLIVPILREVWKPYREALLFWSHVALDAEEPLVGTPDYVFCKHSSLGLVQDQPYLIVTEAKKDDFDAGWGQCLAAMLAAQKLNARRELPIFGCVSNGLTWEFGKLQETRLTQELKRFIISDLPELFAALNALFQQAKEVAVAA